MSQVFDKKTATSASSELAVTHLQFFYFVKEWSDHIPKAWNASCTSKGAPTPPDQQWEL